jgi:hypothetical protein
MLIAFGAGRKRAGISQDIAPVLDKFRSGVERRIQIQCTRNGRHDPPISNSITVMPAIPVNLARWLLKPAVNIARSRNLVANLVAFPSTRPVVFEAYPRKPETDFK